MRIENNIVATEAILETRGWRLWNRSSADLIAGTVDNPDEQPETVLGNWGSSILGSAHKGLIVFNTDESVIKFWDGSAWVRSSKPIKAGSSFPDIILTAGRFMYGGSGDTATELIPTNFPVSGWGAAAADLSFAGYKITNLGAPTLGGDAANKTYVDNVASGIQPKQQCSVASDGNLAGVYNASTGAIEASVADVALAITAIDSGASGVTFTAGAEGTGTRVLLKNQTNSYENGLYRYDTAAGGGNKWKLVRCADSDANDELRAAYVYISDGTFGGTSFIQQTPTSGYDISAPSGTLVFIVFFTQAAINAGSAIDVSGATVSVKLDSGSGQSTTWGANYVVVTDASNQLKGKNASLARAPFWWDTTYGPVFGGYSLPSLSSGDDGKIVFYDHATTSLAVVPGHSTNRVLVTGTDSPGYPVWTTDLPSGTTIGTKTPLFNDAVIPLTLGGGGADLSGFANGSMIYVDTLSNPKVFKSTGAASGEGWVPMSTSTPTIVAMTNIFARVNTWTAEQVFETTAGSTKMKVQRSGDTQPRVGIDTEGASGGRVVFGPGSSTAPDIFLQRYSALTLSMGSTGASASFFLDSTHKVTGTGKWNAAVIEATYGGLGANASGWANGTIPIKTGTETFGAISAGASGTVLRGAGTSAAFSAWTTPSSFAAGDVIYASATNTLSARTKPATVNYVLGLSGSAPNHVPDWVPLGGTRGTGTNGSGASSIALLRKWTTLYNGSGAVARYVSFTHPFGTRDIHEVSIRKTNSGETLNPSERVYSRWDVIDSNTIRVWFSSTPTAADNYVICVSA